MRFLFSFHLLYSHLITAPTNRFASFLFLFVGLDCVQSLLSSRGNTSLLPQVSDLQCLRSAAQRVFRLHYEHKQKFQDCSLLYTFNEVTLKTTLGPFRISMIFGSEVRPPETPYLCCKRSNVFSMHCEVDMFFIGAKNRLTISRGCSTHEALHTSSRLSSYGLSSISLWI